MMSVDVLKQCLCKKWVAGTDYLHCGGRLCDKCKRDGYCNAEHLSEKQFLYIDSDINSSVYLRACPGSGKTEVLAVKFAVETSKWNSPNSGIAVLTFTNSAEDEMRNRIESFSLDSADYPHFIGTFTSWLHGYIANPFLYMLTHHGNDGKLDASLRIVDAECNSGFLEIYKTKYSYGTIRRIPANGIEWNEREQKFVYKGGNKGYESEFAKLTESCSYMGEDFSNTKVKFWKSGFFTYEDVDSLSYQLLMGHDELANLISKRFPTIIVDECQDLSFAQLRILEVLHEHGTAIHLIGDLNQAIYEFRLIEANDTLDFIQKNKLMEMVLDENFRSNQSIVDASMNIIHSSEAIIGKRQIKVKLPLLAVLYRKDQEPRLLEYYLEVLQEEQLSEIDSRIIVRNNSMKQKLLGKKNSTGSINTIEEFARFVYLQKDNSLESFKESIKALAKATQRAYFSNSIHGNSNILFKPEEIETSEWNELLVCLQKHLISDNSVIDLNQSWSNWKKALSKCLESVDNRFLQSPDLKTIRRGNTNLVVDATFSESNESRIPIRVETIHGCKGMSLDSVLFVSSYSRNANSSGSHWRDWFQSEQTEITEAQRLAYVAFSRARHLLVLGIPNPSTSPITDDDKKILTDAGFKIVELD